MSEAGFIRELGRYVQKSRRLARSMRIGGRELAVDIRDESDKKKCIALFEKMASDAERTAWHIQRLKEQLERTNRRRNNPPQELPDR